MRPYAIIFFLLIFLAGCKYIPCSSSSDLDKVNEVTGDSELAGKFIPDEFTAKDVPGFQVPDSINVTLQEDGVVLLRNFPRSVFTDKDYTSDTSIRVNGIGSWNYSSVKSGIKVNSKINLSDNSLVPPKQWEVFKKGSKFMLLLKIGDPDVCLAVRLIRK